LSGRHSNVPLLIAVAGQALLLPGVDHVTFVDVDDTVAGPVGWRGPPA